ncbi:MAG: ferrous iron transport protein B [Clostridia bacterium]
MTTSTPIPSPNAGKIAAPVIARLGQPNAGKSAAPVIALLGQPNAGKSTLFNALTGENQPVGNWPGKTVERKQGVLIDQGVTYHIVDLPGSYSLSANSLEEAVTRDYILSGQADIVCVLADASQLERSLFMLADYAGIALPIILLINMIDVARAQGKTIDTALLERRLHVPVIPIVAAERGANARFMHAVRRALKDRRLLDTDALFQAYLALGPVYANLLPSMRPDGVCTPMWLAAKALEGDRAVLDRRSMRAPLSENEGVTKTAACKFDWISQLLRGAVSAPLKKAPRLSPLDRLMTHRYMGAPMAVLALLLALVFSYLPALPFIALAERIPELARPMAQGLFRMGAPDPLVRLLCETCLNTLYLAVNMVGFVLGVTLVFAVIEEVGFMARISFIFDGAMARLGLQGKSLMPMIVCFGCTTGGVSGARVIDSWGQRALTIALSWAIPCAATWSVVPLVAVTFFGWGAPLVLLGIFAVMIAHMLLTARVFGTTLAPASERTGLAMELPPYHQPKWGNLLRSVFLRVGRIFVRAVRVIGCVSLVFWLLSRPLTPGGQSVIHCVGAAIDPVTRALGMGWRMFMAFLASALSKEAALGALSMLFAGARGGAVAALRAEVTRPEALAFIFAFTFNVPCVMALTATRQETRSPRLTFKLAAYYLLMALALSFITYRVASWCL